MPQDTATNRLLYRPSRRTVLKSGAGTVTVLGAAPVAAAAQESDDRPAAVDKLRTALDCFERVAGTAEMALVVDFRREGIRQLRELTDDGEDLEILRRAESHNEAAARGVRFGDKDAAQTQLERTTDALEQVGVDDELVNNLIMAQEEPFQIIFGEDAEALTGEVAGINYNFNDDLDDAAENVDFLNSTVVKLLERTVDLEDATLELSLSDFSRISNPRTSRRIVFKTEAYLHQMRAAIEQLRTNDYTISFEDLSTLIISSDSSSYSISVGLASWLWATGYATSRASVTLMLVHLGLDTVLDLLNPIPEVTERLLAVFANYIPDSVVRGVFEVFIDDWWPGEAEDGDVTGRLEALIPFGLVVTHLLKAEVNTVDEFMEQLSISEETPVEDVEELLGHFASLSTVVPPLEDYTDVADIDLLNTPIEEFGEEINEQIRSATGVDIFEAVDDIQGFAQSLLLQVVNMDAVGNFLPDPVTRYLRGHLGGS